MKQLVSLPIVGAKFRPPAAGLLSVLPQGASLLVRREPDNPHDANALQVLVERSTLEQIPPAQLQAACEGFGFSAADILDAMCWHLGYVPRKDAEVLAPSFDEAGAHEVPARLTFALDGRLSVSFEVP